MTRQAMFDLAAVGMLCQGCKSSNGLNCKYEIRRGEITLNCAVGFILKEACKDRPNGREVMTFPGDIEKLLKQFPDLGDPLGWEGTFLMHLQRIHDLHNPPRWKDKLTELAGAYNLNTDCLKEFDQ